MKTPEQKAAHNAYMKAYRLANLERWNANVRKRHLADPTLKQAAQKAYREKKKANGGRSAETLEKARVYARKWRAENPELAAECKRKYYVSVKGKLQKRKEDLAFQASGGRSRAEAKRAAAGVSEARKEARLRYQLMRAAGERVADELALFTLAEAVRLRKLREQMLGGKWHVDHIIPVSKGGSSCAGNLQVVPARWNQQKNNLHSERFFAHAKGGL